MRGFRMKLSHNAFVKIRTDEGDFVLENKSTQGTLIPLERDDSGEHQLTVLKLKTNLESWIRLKYVHPNNKLEYRDKEKSVDMETSPFKEQIERGTLHDVFSITNVTIENDTLILHYDKTQWIEGTDAIDNGITVADILKILSPSPMTSKGNDK